MVVIGAGTGGLVAAAGSAGVGAKVALVEEWMMGGDCLNVGCVPSKAIIRCAHSVHEVFSQLMISGALSLLLSSRVLPLGLQSKQFSSFPMHCTLKAFKVHRIPVLTFALVVYC